jgi:hypothetical protein
LLDQPPGEVAATSVELGQGQVAKAFHGVRLIAVVARPVRFPGMTFAGRFEIAGALKPDQRNRVGVGRRPGTESSNADTTAISRSRPITPLDGRSRQSREQVTCAARPVHLHICQQAG